MSNKGADAHPFAQWVNLEQPRLGTRVVYANDEFFAAKERLIDPDEPVFVKGKYDDHGKWMDGWESRRKRGPGHDHCIIRLGIPGVVRGVDIDTTFFTGNYPPFASIEACTSDEDLPGDTAGWRETLPKVALNGNSHHLLPIQGDAPVTHLRFNIYPDGGVARLRIYGEVKPDWRRHDPDKVIDLFALENGGRALMCNNQHFSSMHRMNVPGRALTMGDSWGTRRRREPGNDWVIIALGHPGVIEKIDFDTNHHKGNFPDRTSIQAALVPDANPATLEAASEAWPVLLPPTKLEADRQHFFVEELNDLGVVSHLRVTIYPDGGISRLRIYGRIAKGA